MNITDLTYAVHPINIFSENVERSAIQDEADLIEFVKNLISSQLLENENRRFYWPSDTALVPSLLKSMSSAEATLDGTANTMAERLLEKEKDAQRRVQHMDVDIQKGTLIQIVFKNDEVPCVLLAKVHLAPFLGEADYKKHNGYPLENTVLKMCYVEFDGQQKPAKVSVADSNSRLSEYWWKEFLELTELTSDEYNTKTALASINALLTRRLKKDHRADYYRLHNNLIGYFSTQRQYNHRRMIDHVFGDYTPVDSSVSIDEIRAAVEVLPTQKQFDARFSISQELVEKKRKTTIPLTPQIDLELKESIESLPETIFAASLEDGTRGVFIRSEDGFELFKSGNEVMLNT